MRTTLSSALLLLVLAACAPVVLPRIGSSGVDVAGVGVGVTSTAKRQTLTKAGNPESCKTEAEATGPPHGCSALLRVEVMPLGAARKVAVTCPAETKWDGESCVRNKVLTKTQCPSGSKQTGDKCVVGTVDCPGSSKWDGSRCVSDPIASPPPPSRPSSGSTPSEMVLVPAGSFQMGCASGDSTCDDDEKPRHEVTVDAFHIDKTEVTVGQYRSCENAGECTTPKVGGHCNWEKSGRDSHPINCVDWHQATAYCGWKNKQLPTEAEWEKAARGTDGRIYTWGDPSPSCNLAIMGDGGDGYGKDRTWPVGSKPAGKSPYGGLDMAGNVWEWVSDWYDKGYYASSSRRNPTGPSGGSSRVFRGGGWSNVSARNMRASFRSWYTPGVRVSSVGFRCARPSR